MSGCRQCNQNHPLTRDDKPSAIHCQTKQSCRLVTVAADFGVRQQENKGMHQEMRLGAGCERSLKAGKEINNGAPFRYAGA